MKRIDLTNQTFHYLTVIEDKPGGGRNSKIKCRCKCGKVGEHFKGAVKAGHTKSCGCWDWSIHGLTGTALYRWWGHFQEQCDWESVESLHATVGRSDRLIYRPDPDKPYGPDNWTFERRVGLRVEIDGTTKNMAEWGRFIGVTKQRANQLHKLGKLTTRVRERTAA